MRYHKAHCIFAGEVAKCQAQHPSARKNPNAHELLLDFHANAPSLRDVARGKHSTWKSPHFVRSELPSYYSRNLHSFVPGFSSRVWLLISPVAQVAQSRPRPLMTKLRCSDVFGRFGHCLVMLMMPPPGLESGYHLGIEQCAMEHAHIFYIDDLSIWNRGIFP